MLDADFVIVAHDKILKEEPGLCGFSAAGPGGVDAAIRRVEHYALYAQLDDIFGIAAWYAVAIARGHVFNDGNKRTALVCALAYLEQQEITISKTPALEDLMVDVAEGKVSAEDLANYLSAVAL